MAQVRPREIERPRELFRDSFGCCMLVSEVDDNDRNSTLPETLIDAEIENLCSLPHL